MTVKRFCKGRFYIPRSQSIRRTRECVCVCSFGVFGIFFHKCSWHFINTFGQSVRDDFSVDLSTQFLSVSKRLPRSFIKNRLFYVCPLILIHVAVVFLFGLDDLSRIIICSDISNFIFNHLHYSQREYLGKNTLAHAHTSAR